MTPAEKTSALSPAGPAAEAIADLWWVMFSVLGVFFVAVMVLLWFGIRTKRVGDTPQPPLGDGKFIILGGLAVPGVLMLGLLIYTIALTSKLWEPKEGITVQLTGHMWWWDVRYPGTGIVNANEIHIPVGQPVRVELRSNDVIHSLWVPSLSGKTDLIPGIMNVHWLEAKEPGVYRGQCAEFCGLQHARMAILVIALPPEEFLRWIEERRVAKAAPRQAALRRGLETFNKVGCAECHTIRGATPVVRVGPDLTHVGSRLQLGGGVVANNFGNLAGWITNPQALKPGNKMPATYIDPGELPHLVSYLMSLK